LNIVLISNKRSEKMKFKFLTGFFTMLVFIILCTSNGAATNGMIWINQATLSVPADNIISQDPENSGFNTDQVVVWEEQEGPSSTNYDIYMKYSRADGLPGSWLSPPTEPATTTNVNERNPAVTVNQVSGGPVEIHIVYERWNGANWEVCHVWTANFGGIWNGPTILNFRGGQHAIDPAIVSTQDVNVPGIGPGLLVQFTWAELNTAPTPLYEIMYDAFYYDPTTIPPARGYLPTPALIRSNTAGHCYRPEIASVDETLNPLAYDYYYSIVWEDPFSLTPGTQWDIWYVDGTTTVIPGGPAATVVNFGTMGKISANLPGSGDATQPDIAATQDYVTQSQLWYYHVTWVYIDTTITPVTYQIDTCYFPSGMPNPGSIWFIPTTPAKGPTTIVLDNPTIASKLVPINVPPNFETWVCWEDSTTGTGVTTPDIWFNMGQYARGMPFGWAGVGPALVPYAKPGSDMEFNPELWNRNDIARPFPPLTHLVFDMTQNNLQEVEYIDP
jgi:hypothetical protein